MKPHLTALSAIGLLLAPATSFASVITWGPAQNTVDANDIMTGGAVVEARNGIPQVTYLVDAPAFDTTVAGIFFDATNFLGQAFLTEPTNSMLGGTSTGDPAYDLLVGNATVCDGATLGNGSSNTSANYLVAGLNVGSTYKVQLWYCDVRPTYDGRLMILDSSVTLQSGINGAPNDFGQYAIGTFVADAATQLINVDSNGTAGRAHITAILVREDEPGTKYCSGDGVAPHTLCPCANNNNGSPGGCDWGDLAFPGGGMLAATGTASMAANDTLLVAAGISNNFGIFFGANNQVNGGNGNPLNDGLRCAGGGLVRLIPPTMASGNQAITPASVQSLDTGAAAGVTRRYQYWFRTPTGPCGGQANLTNGYEIVWLP